MANTLLTSQIVSNSFLQELKVSAVFLAMGNRGLYSDFQNKSFVTGDTVSVRKQNFYTAGDGGTATVQGINQTIEPLTINHQYHTLVDVTSVQETLSIDNFTMNYLTPASQTIAARFNKDIIDAGVATLNYAEGSASNPLNNFAYIANAQALMTQLNMSKSDRYAVFGSTASAQLRSALYNTFNQDFNRDIILDGEMGMLSNFRCFEDEQIFAHVAGTATTFTLAADVASGDTSLSITGTSGRTIKIGDIFSFTGVNAVSPRGHQDIGELFTFKAAANLTLNGSTQTLQVTPILIWDPTNAAQNISAQPLTGNVVTNFGTYVPNFMFDRRALDIVCPPLAMLETTYCNVASDKEYNMSVRVSKQGDIVNSINYIRLDVLAGFKWHNQYGMTLISQP